MNIRSKFIKNSGWMVGQQIYSMLLSLIVGALSARYLGPSNYGLINYGASLIAFFTTVCQMGLGGVIINEMIKYPRRQNSFLGTALVLRLVFSIISVPIIWLIIVQLEPQNNILHIVTLFQSFSVVLQSYDVLNYWFQMKLEMKYVSIATMIALTVVSIWKVVLLATKASVTFFALSTSIQTCVCGIVVIGVFISKYGWKLSFSIFDAKYLLSNSYNYIISDLAITFYTQMDKLMIGNSMNETEVGLYSAAVTLSSIWGFVPSALIDSARPIIVEYKQKDEEKYLSSLKQLLLVVTIISAFVCVCFNLFGWLAIKILYGESYMDALGALNILVWSMFMAEIGNARSIWVIAENYYKYPKYYVIIGAIINIVLNYILILNMGKIGASIATLVTQAVVSFIAPCFFKETRKFLNIYVSCFGEFHNLIKRLKGTIK